MPESRQKIQESKDTEIVAYEEQYRSTFRNLNVEWISAYFELEENDLKMLDHPEEYILNRGGKILVALYRGEPSGVCALIKMDDDEYDFELAKMAVSPKAQGKNLGFSLGKAIIHEAKRAGAKNLYLESNTVLQPAIKLYEKLGFQKITGHPSPYKRVNIQMALNIENYRND